MQIFSRRFLAEAALGLLSNGLIHKAYWISSIILVHLISGTGSSVPAHRGPVTLWVYNEASFFRLVSTRFRIASRLKRSSGQRRNREVAGIEQEQNLLTAFFIELTPGWNDSGAVQKASWG